MSTTTSSTVLMAVVAGGAAWWALRPAKAKAAAPRRRPSPFKPGSHCTLLADGAEIRRWIDEVAAPAALPRIEAFPPSVHEPPDEVRLAVLRLVDDLFQRTTKCGTPSTDAARQIWKGLFCDVMVQLVVRGKVDEELDDVLRVCTDPARDPRLLLLGQDASEPPRPPPPRPPSPEPLEPPPLEPSPMDAGPAPMEPPPNLWRASTRAELTEIGLTRLMEGTAAGAPIKAPSAHLVLFAHNPAWPRLPEAQAELVRLARRHPRLMFVETSFVDTQRHFGKPEDLYGLTWVLTAAGPDGRVFPEAIVRTDSSDPPPSTEQWLKVIAHASGFVGAPSVQRIPRPRRFGDLVIALAARSHSATTRPTSPIAAPRDRRRRRLARGRVRRSGPTSTRRTGG